MARLGQDCPHPTLNTCSGGGWFERAKAPKGRAKVGPRARSDPLPSSSTESRNVLEPSLARELHVPIVRAISPPRATRVCVVLCKSAAHPLSLSFKRKPKEIEPSAEMHSQVLVLSKFLQQSLISSSLFFHPFFLTARV